MLALCWCGVCVCVCLVSEVAQNHLGHKLFGRGQHGCSLVSVCVALALPIGRAMPRLSVSQNAYLAYLAAARVAAAMRLSFATMAAAAAAACLRLLMSIT